MTFFFILALHRRLVNVPNGVTGFPQENSFPPGTCFLHCSLQEQHLLSSVLSEQMNEAFYWAVKNMWRMVYLRFKRSCRQQAMLKRK